jgi:hypothetical protein
MSDRDDKGRYLPAHSIPGPGARSKYEPWMDDQAYRLALLGLTDEQIAEAFGIALSTLNEWKNNKFAFSESLNKGRVRADGDVAHGLYQRAVGMTVYEERLAHQNGKQVVTRVAKQIPPDPGAAAMWLGARQRKLWAKSKDDAADDPAAPGIHDLANMADDELAERIAELQERQKIRRGEQ